MKFRYKKIAQKILRPVIPILVSYKNARPVKYFALIDSGADKCYLASEIAPLIGIPNYKTGKREDVSGINGKSDAFFHNVTISVGGWPFEMEVGFMEKSSLTMLGYGVLGHRPFFELFSAKFDFQKEEIEIKEK
jgi:hypothetical protein